MSYQNEAMVSRNLYHVFLASVCGLAVWVAYSIYQVLVVPVEITIDKSLLVPIAVNLDEKVLEQLMERKFVSTDISQLPNTALEVANSIEALPIEIPEVTEEASQSGTVDDE